MKGWLFLLMAVAVAGAVLIAVCVWLDVRDGVPTMQKGDQPFEVVLTGGLGMALLGNGVVRAWWVLRRWWRAQNAQVEP